MVGLPLCLVSVSALSGQGLIPSCWSRSPEGQVRAGSVPFLLRLIDLFLVCWVFVAVCRLSLVAASRVCSLLQCLGFSLQWLFSMQSTGSRLRSLRHEGLVVVAVGL